MNINARVLVTTCLILFTLASASCTTLSRRKPLDITPYTQELSLASLEKTNIIFEEALPGKQLNETVWDNKSGPFWDIQESKQIGFTQDYKKFVPVAVSAGLLGGAIGGAVVGAAAGPTLVDTRIVIPFGNIFSGTFESAMKNSLKDYSICFNPSCKSQSPSQNELKIKVEKFYVWEGPVNHLNLYVKGESRYRRTENEIKEYRFEKSLLSQKLGTVMSTHRSFLKEMNRISNSFAQEIITDIINNTIK
jgi:hypothetical protein